MVRKHNFRPMGTNGPHAAQMLTKDGFNYFIENIIKSDSFDNIHFPKVYNIKKITDKEGNWIHKYDVERLIPLKELSNREIYRLFTDNFKRHVKEYEKMDSYDLEDTRSNIGFILSSAIRKNDHSELRSAELKKAVSLLHNMNTRASDEGHFMDLHSDNVMARRTPYGLQLVINDPFA